MAFLGGLGGCRTIPMPPPLGKRPEKMPEFEPSRAEAYYHFLKAQRCLLADDILGAIREYEEAARNDPQSADLHVDLALLYQRHGELTKALSHVEKALKIDPKNQEAHFILAGLHVGLNQLKEAIESYERLLEINPHNREARLFLAALYAQQRRFPKAISTIQLLLKKDPDLLVAHYYLGRFYLEMNRPEQAKKSFQLVLGRDPEFLPALFDLAQALEQEKQYNQALALYRRILQRQGQNSRAWANIGRIYLITGRKNLAQRAFQKLKALEKDSPASSLQVGLILLEQKYYQDAIQELRPLLTNPRYRNQASYFIGAALEERNQIPAAIQMYERIERNSELFVPARLRMAYLYFQDKKKDQARRLLEDLRALAPDKEEVYLTISYFYEEEGLWHRAIAVLEEGVQKLPQSAELYSRMALLYDKQKNRVQSIKLIKKALELEPDNPDVLNFLGYTYAEEGINLDEAERLILKALEAKPDSGHIIDSLGWVYYKKGLYDKAVLELERAYQKLSTDATVAEHLGDVYLKQNRLQDALRMYKKALELENADIPRLREKIRKLQRQLGPEVL